MKNRTTMICLAVVAGELFAGVTMLAAYQAWIQPGAPRNQAAEQAKAETVAAPAPAPPPLQPPAPQPEPVVVPPPVQQKASTPKPRPVVAVAVQAPAPKFKPVQPMTPQPQAVQLPAAPPPLAAPVAQHRPTAMAPTDAATAMQRGIHALNSRDFAGAATLLRQARQAQPTNANLGYLLGMALEGSGEIGAAIDAFRSCNSGPYEKIARNHVKSLAKKLGK